jgi:hypothetical protein
MVIKVCQSVSSCDRGIKVLSLYWPMSAMSLLKSPQRIVLWLGEVLIWWVIKVWISGMRGRSSG